MNKNQLIEKIEKLRNSRIITYLTSDRTGPVNAQVAMDIIPVISKQLQKRSIRTTNYVENILDIFTSMGYHFLVDANISYRAFIGYENNTWAVDGVRIENFGWADHINFNHILNTYTRDSLREAKMVELTSPIDGSTSTIIYDTVENIITCGSNNKTPVNTTLTAYPRRVTAYVCQNLSSTDLSNLIWILDVPKFILFTNEKCLGWCSASLPSFFIEKNRIITWACKFINQNHV